VIQTVADAALMRLLDVVRARGDEIRIVNLKPSTKYALEVRAKNEVGPGPPYTLNIETERVRK